MNVAMSPYVAKYNIKFRGLLYPVPVRHFPSTSRSIRLGDVSEANGRETFLLFHVTQNALSSRDNEAWKLGKSLLRTWSCVGERKGLVMYFRQELYSKYIRIYYYFD